MRILLLMILFLIVGCDTGKAPRDSIQDLVSEVDSELCENENILECLSDSDCSSDRFCDPYGMCVCRHNIGLMSENRQTFDNKGKCLSYNEINDKFCNGRAQIITTTGYTKGVVDEVRDGDKVFCRCHVGYSGEMCEIRNSYGNTLPKPFSADENSKIIDRYNQGRMGPEPYCKRDNDCGEGLFCRDDGYCACSGEVDHLPDPAMEDVIRKAFDVPSGPIPLELLADMFFVIFGYNPDTSYLKCFPQARQVIVRNPNTYVTDIETIASLKFLTHIVFTGNYNDVIDYTPLTKVSSFHEINFVHTANRTAYEVLQEINPTYLHRLNIATITKVQYTPGDNLAFIKRFKNLRAFQYRNTSNDSVSFNLDSFYNKAAIRELLIIGNIEIENEAKLKEFKNIQRLYYMPRESSLKLSDIDTVFDKASLLQINSSIIDSSIGKNFPNIVELSTKMSLKDFSYMKDLKNLKKYSLLGPLSYDETRKNTESLKNLKKMNSFKITEINIDNIEFVRSMLYLSFFDAGRDLYMEDNNGGSFFCERDRYDFKKGRDNSPVERLLYLVNYRDQRCGIDSLDPMVKNCKNGGLFCWDFIPNMPLTNSTRKIIDYTGQIINYEKEHKNYEFLEEYGNIQITQWE